MGKAGTDASMRCVHCGTPVAAVYVEYSPGNIRLSECVWLLLPGSLLCDSWLEEVGFYFSYWISFLLLQAQCGYAADEYVECEMMVITRFSLLVPNRIPIDFRV